MKRVCDLKPGDRFYWFGREFKVRKVNGSVQCAGIDSRGWQTNNLVKFGVNNQMKVEMVKNILACY